MLGSSGEFAHAYKLATCLHDRPDGFTLDGDLVGPYERAAQARQACENIKSLMEMAGGSIDDVIKHRLRHRARVPRRVLPIIRSYFKVDRAAPASSWTGSPDPNLFSRSTRGASSTIR